jgi:ABC-3C biological conflict system middle component
MILPAKHLRHDRALLDVGAEILAQLEDARTVSELWERVRITRKAGPELGSLSFDWFILALSLLYMVSALDFRAGIVIARRQ